MDTIKIYIKIKNLQAEVLETRVAIKELDELIDLTSNQITEAFDNDKGAEVMTLCNKSDELRAKDKQLSRKLKQLQKGIESLQKEFNQCRSESIMNVKELHSLCSWGFSL